jgi:hypothetical protein
VPGGERKREKREREGESAREKSDHKLRCALMDTNCHHDLLHLHVCPGPLSGAHLNDSVTQASAHTSACLPIPSTKTYGSKASGAMHFQVPALLVRRWTVVCRKTTRLRLAYPLRCRGYCIEYQ